MGLIKIVVFQLLILATANFLFAQGDSNDTATPPQQNGEQGPPHNQDHEDDHEHHEEDHEGRFFFSIFPTLGSCNYTTQNGTRCSTCTQSLTCLVGNVGIVRNCRGIFRHCNNGYCSLFQSASCANSTG